MKRAHKISSIATGLLLATTSSSAYAADEEVLKQLKAMQAQMSRMQGEMSSLKQELAVTKERAANAETKSRTASIKMAEHNAKLELKKETEAKLTLGPGPKIESADGQNSFRLGGFAQIDAGVFDDDRRDHPDGTNIRRARLSASGAIAKEFKYKLEYDFSPNTAALTDVYMEYTGFDPISIMVGQFKEPFGLETLTSDLFTTFMERGSPVLFSPDRNIGITVGSRGDFGAGPWTATAGVFGANATAATTDDESRDFTGRFTLAPIAEKDQVIHLGVAASHRIPEAVLDSMRFQSRAETRLPTSQSVDTGVLTGIDSTNLLGLEAAGVYGPASIQAEYVLADVNRQGALVEPTFSGYYAEASYFLTGESRTYLPASGRFDRVVPKDPFTLSKGGWGAWQVAARYSSLDLSDSTVLGGQMSNMTLGLRWQPQANIAFLANYVHVDTDSSATTPHDNPDVLMFRAQFDF